MGTQKAHSCVVVVLAAFAVVSGIKQVEAANGSFECPTTELLNSTTFFPDPVDCSRFYVCENGMPSHMSCPYGTYFNPKLVVCDIPRSASDCPSVTTKSPETTTTTDIPFICPTPASSEDTVFLPDPLDCNKYYICNNGRPDHMTCPAGTYFNSKYSICDIPKSDSDCVVTEPPQTSTSSDWTTASFPVVCPTPEHDDPRSVFIPDPLDCNKFYSCDSGTPVHMSCPYGTYFNSKLLVCDIQKSPSDCMVTTTSSSWTSEPPQTTTTEEPLTSSASPTTENPSICPVPGSRPDTVFLPDPLDCTKFYICDNGRPVHMTCPAGTYFNSKYSICDIPKSDSDCVVTESPQTSTSSDWTTASFPVVCPTPGPDDSRSVFIPDPLDCTKFYFCDSGTPVHMSCPYGMYFNSKLLVCDIQKSSSDCVVTTTSSSWTTSSSHTSTSSSWTTASPHTSTQGPTTSTEAHTTTGPMCPTPGPVPVSVFLPDPVDCTKFYLCEHGTPMHLSCPYGTYFNSKLLACDVPNSSSDCIIPTTSAWTTDYPDTTTSSWSTSSSSPTTVGPLTCPTPGPLPYTVFLPDPLDCTKFYICDNGRPVHMTCPYGTYFNPNLLICDVPKSSSDCVVTTTPFYTTTSAEASSSIPFICPTPGPLPNTEFIPDPLDCTKFYVCDNGTATHMTCPDGTYFNPEVLACDTPESSSVCNVTTTPIPTTQPPQTTPEPTTVDPLACPTPGPFPYTVLLPDPIDCTKFYKCDNGFPIHESCPYGLYFNPLISECDFPDQSGCMIPPTNPPSTVETTTITTTPSSVSFQCPNPPPEPWIYMFPVPGNCSEYFECEDLVAFLKRCPPGLYFRSDLQICDWPDQSDCVLPTDELSLIEKKSNDIMSWIQRLYN